MTTAVAARASHPTNQHSVVFGDKYFKFARVTIDSTCKLYISIFYKALSYSVWIFSKDYCNYYKNIAKFKYVRAINQHSTYLKYGNKIIEFSSNFFSSLKRKDFVKVKKFEDLKTYYGKDTIEQWESIGNETIPLAIDRKEMQEEFKDGSCLGISLDFISNYLKEIQTGKTPIDAIKSIAHRFKNGASKEAEIAQIFYQLLDILALKTVKKQKIDELRDRKIKEAKDFLIKDEIERLPTMYDKLNALQNPKEFEEALKSKIDEKINEIIKDYNSKFIKKIMNIESHKRIKPIALKLGLNIQKPDIFSSEEIQNEDKFNFNKFLQKLSNGTYNLSIRARVNKKIFGHSMSMIKTDEKVYLLDANFACFEFDSDNSYDQLWCYLRQKYLKEGPCILSFILLYELE